MQAADATRPVARGQDDRVRHPEELLERWGLNGPFSVESPELGSMNETWLIRHQRGRVVLRRHRTTERDDVVREHAVMDHVRRRVRTPELLANVDGDRIVAVGGHLHSLYSWEPGEHPMRASTGPAKAFNAGATLALIHESLRGFGVDGPAEEALPGDDTMLARCEVLEAAVRERQELMWVVEDLAQRRRWVARNPDVPSRCVGTPQMIHGDYQLTNVLFVGNEVSAVIDWDRARVASPLMEVVRAIDHGLGLHPSDSRSFLAGYRSLRDISPGELVAAVEYWTHQQARSLWALERACLDGNERVAAMASPFRPFTERWAEAGVA